ncbi:hypothetical protein H4R19_001002, partial [Coemansia spiralis]
TDGHNLETVYQAQLNTLMLAIEDHLTMSGGKRQISWCDTHARPPRGGDGKRMPDGLLIAGHQHTPEWHRAVVVFELKSDRHNSNDGGLQGQMLKDFADVAEQQPRRHIFGVGISAAGETHVWLCKPSKVWCARLGTLPSTQAWSDDHQRVVRFLLLLYQQLPRDYGFLVAKEDGMFAPFGVDDIPNYDPASMSGARLGAGAVTVMLNQRIGGRQPGPVGPKSWLYRALVRCSTSSQDGDGDGGETVQGCVLKYHLYDREHSEVAIHRRALEMGIPYVPCLLSSATVAVPNEHITGEILVMEYAGTSIQERILSITPGLAFRIVDYFAAYTHTILAAATGDGNQFILHRDISTGNLMVSDSGNPAVIDWGCGVVAQLGESRVPSSMAIIGTAPYMSIRTLLWKSTRSVLDDLESLFLVLSRCLCDKYAAQRADVGEGDFAKMWRGEPSLTEIADTRSKWLATQATYWSWMALQGCPRELETLAKGLYNLLFAANGLDIFSLMTNELELRLGHFDAAHWLDVLDSAAVASSSGYAGQMVHLQELRGYVQATPDCGKPAQEPRPTPTPGPQQPSGSGSSGPRTRGGDKASQRPPKKQRRNK